MFISRKAVSPLFKFFRGLILTSISLVIGIALSAQVDTLFWFAAPDFSGGHGEEPIYLRFTTLDQAAEVTVSQPANPAFVPVQILIPSNSSQTLDMSPLKSAVECTPPDQVLNKGLLIRSTALLNVYYENASFYNPEIFTLKGRNALGREFIIPMQDVFPNGNYNPVPYASFNIVATEDATTVEITPRHNIVGHNAGSTFTVVLNKGEVYVARAAVVTAGQHLSGSVVKADKPVAITISDDSMAAFSIYGGCADLGGDQITSISNLGQLYVTIPGTLNPPNDAVFIVGVTDGTQVSVNGNILGTVDQGTSLRAFSNGAPMMVRTSQPAYVLHMSGFGCEVGLDQMPLLDPCNGSRLLSINRSSDQPLFINILAYQDLKEHFLFNGRSDVITPGVFLEVPGTNGDWWYANIQVPLATLGVGGAGLIENREGPFQLSLIHGGPGTGTMYGYFSDYGKLEILPELETTCAGGTSITLDTTYRSYRWSTGDTTDRIFVSQSGWYSVTVTNMFGCVASDSVFMNVLPEARNIIDLELCPGDSIQIAGEWFDELRPSGEIFLEGGSAMGCDSIVDVQLHYFPAANSRYEGDLCPGESIRIGTEVFDENRRSGHVLLPGASVNGCDSIVDVELRFYLPAEVTINELLCPGEGITIGSEWFDENRPSGTVILPGASRNGCDSTITVDLAFRPVAEGYLSASLCPGEQLIVGTETFDEQRSSGTVILSGASFHGCDSIVQVSLQYYPPAIGTLYPEICPQDTLVIEGVAFHEGNRVDTLYLPGSSLNGCDSVIVVALEVYPLADLHITDTLCPGERLQAGGEWFSETRPEGLVKLKGGSHYGCDSTIKVSLFYPENELSLDPEHVVNYGSSIQLRPWFARPFEWWSWFPPEGLDCTDCPYPWVFLTESGQYVVKATDPFGCVYTAATRIIVRKERKIFIPNAITPNDDGNNDGFTAFGNYFAERIEVLEIFDRWGDLVIRIEDIPLNEPWRGWDGMHHGKPVVPAVFAYRIRVRYLDQTHEVFYGDVTVLR